MDILVEICAWILILIGFIGTLLPILPGTPLMLGGMFLIAWWTSFAEIGWGTLFILLLLCALSVIVDIISSVLGAKRVGASPLALVGAAVGTIVGLFFGLIGIFVGPFIGAMVGEYFARRDLIRAGGVGLATWLGIILGGAVKLAIACMMLGIFVFFYFV